MLKKTPDLTKIHLWWNMVPGVQNVKISLCTSSAEDVTCWLMTSPFIVNVNLQLSIATPKVQPKVWLAHLASSTQDWATNWTSSKQLNKLHTFATSFRTGKLRWLKDWTSWSSNVPPCQNQSNTCPLNGHSAWHIHFAPFTLPTTNHSCLFWWLLCTNCTTTA